MNLLQAIILGIVQGLTEFLPISSSGHLVLFQKILGVDISTPQAQSMIMTFYVALHVGTLFAVVFFFWKKVMEMIRKPFSKLPLQIVVATIPAIIANFLFGDFIESTYMSSLLLGPGFLFTGLAIVVAERLSNGKKGLEELKTTDSLLIGTAQAVALLPSVSRSGMTITTSLTLGLQRGFAADFSFLMSIPPILGGALLDVVDIMKGTTVSFETIGIGNILAGMVAAGVTGFFAIKLMINAIKNMKLKYFAYYVFALGIFIIIGQLFFKESVQWLLQ
ncbi:MAG: undecaprenyl-diphosphate phosphatase [Acetivibrionales bacterium]|jgi:undecaprenyl-diphosphatase|nr:undecaprenyl-diphosphate phosphatase [Clostridiaceae bacterium]